MSGVVRQCPKCKTSETNNRSLQMMINECGHPICNNCVDNIFARNSAPCPTCGKVLKKNAFWKQKFDNPKIEREVYYRKKLAKTYCLKEDEFPDAKAFNAYLERIEDIVFSLVEDHDVAAIQAEIENFKVVHSDAIERNRKKLSADQVWINRMIEEEDERQKRVNAEIQNENVQNQKKSADDINKEVLEELKAGKLPPEVILDRKRKQKIEQEMRDRDEEKKRAARKSNRHEKVTFGSIASTGQPYVHIPPRQFISGAPIPTPEEMKKQGYFMHVPFPENRVAACAGGFTPAVALTRYLIEARQEMFSGL